jgi:acyl-homoserine lactone acylase PvdQ
LSHPRRLSFAASVSFVSFVSLVWVAGCRNAPPPPPLAAQVSGTFAAAGLSAPVRIVRDRWGVPHIYAKSQDDLFFAQGLVQAQDRLFQMDLWRRSVQGRVAEVLGPNFDERDAMTRRMQYRGDRDVEWASYGPDTKAIASAFVRGINAWVALAQARPPEEFVLAGWKPEPWTPDDLLNRTDAFTASGDAIDEIFRARLAAAVGARRADALLAPDRPTTVPPGLDLTAISYVVADAIRRVGTPPFFLGLARPVTTHDSALPEPLHVAAAGSSPARTLAHPSLRYLVHLNAPGWNVAGATVPWLPGVAIGHNDRIAWDATAADVDTQDVYVEKVNPSNAHQVEDRGRWVETTIVKEPIIIRGRKEPFAFERELTRHGPIIASDRGRALAYTVRWSGTEPGAAAELAALGLDRATSWAEFRAALAHWKMPARRFTYADVDGNSGFQVAALIPIRSGWNGSVPAPGWTGMNEWAGWQTIDDLPHALEGHATRSATGLSTRPAAKVTVASVITRLARVHPDRAEALLQRLAAAPPASDGRTVQRTRVADAVAEAAHDPLASGPVTFAHPLGITAAARRRFNIGPLTPPVADAAPFSVTFSPADWDRSSAINAPGQSGSAESPHFADLAKFWIGGERVPLVFSDQAVQANAETTLTLVPR